MHMSCSICQQVPKAVKMKRVECVYFPCSFRLDGRNQSKWWTTKNATSLVNFDSSCHGLLFFPNEFVHLLYPLAFNCAKTWLCWLCSPRNWRNFPDLKRCRHQRDVLVVLQDVASNRQTRMVIDHPSNPLGFLTLLPWVDRCHFYGIESDDRFLDTKFTRHFSAHQINAQRDSESFYKFWHMLTASGWFNVHEGKDKGQGDTAPYKRPKRPPGLFFAAGLLRWCRRPGCGVQVVSRLRL